MGKQFVLWIFGAGFFLFLIGLAVYQPVIKPWHVRWGAVDAEVQASFVGDEIVTDAHDQTTRAIDIHAPAAQIWPWLMQLGQGRGGWFSYDFLENLAGCDIHTLDSIIPDLQNLQVGDTIKLGPQKGLAYYQVAVLEPNTTLVLRSVNATTGELGETWGFYLVEKDSTLTRLIVRHRGTPSLDKTERTVNSIFEPITFVMEQRMLHGIRDHAQNGLQPVDASK